MFVKLDRIEGMSGMSSTCHTGGTDSGRTAGRPDQRAGSGQLFPLRDMWKTSNMSSKLSNLANMSKISTAIILPILRTDLPMGQNVCSKQNYCHCQEVGGIAN